jgi:hypothetical protein
MRKMEAVKRRVKRRDIFYFVCLCSMSDVEVGVEVGAISNSK